MKNINIRAFYSLGLFGSMLWSSLGSLAQASPKTPERLDFLKKQLTGISRLNSEKLDNWVAVRSVLQPLANEISGYQEILSAEDQVSLKKGVWKQLWTDDTDDLRGNTPIQKTDRTKTYQVVFPGGLFYNLTEITTPLGRFSGFLRGDYTTSNDVFNIEFNRVRLKAGKLGEESKIEELVSNVEQGNVSGIFRLPFPDKYPRGPIGAKGEIKSIYIDDEIRVDIGFNTADGVKDLFILEKISQDIPE